MDIKKRTEALLLAANRALSVKTFPSDGLLSKAYFLRGRINLSLQNYIESILDLDKTSLKLIMS